jgi:hypothetical protein
LSLLQDFDRIVLDEAVLGVARQIQFREIKKSFILEGKIFSWDFLMTTVLFLFFLLVYGRTILVLQIFFINLAVLGVAGMFREELVVMPHEEDYNGSNRYAAYRQYIYHLGT